MFEEWWGLGSGVREDIGSTIEPMEALTGFTRAWKGMCTGGYDCVEG